MLRKALLHAAIAVSLAAGIVEAKAADPQSTWDRVMSTKVVRLGCAPSEPWCFKDLSGSDAPGAVTSNGTVYRGVAVQLGEDVAKALGAKLEIVDTTWGNAVAGLQANQYDMMFQLDATPQRAVAIDFAGPVLWYPVAFLVRNDFAPTTWDQLNDPKYRLGAPMGTTFVDVIKKYAPKATLMTFQQSDEMIAALQSGRADGAVSTGSQADVTRLRLKTGKTLVPTPAVIRSSSVGIRKELDERWKNFLQVVVTYSYDTGRTQQLYEDFLSARGMDPKTATSTRKEDFAH